MNKEKTRQAKKGYRKPQVNRVKLVPKMEVLAACHVTSGELGGCPPGTACSIA